MDLAEKISEKHLAALFTAKKSRRVWIVLTSSSESYSSRINGRI